MINKLKQIPFIRKLNQYRSMPIVWWTIFVNILPLVFGLLRISTVWRIGILFIIFNSIVSYHVGNLIKVINLKRYWLLFFPVCFCLIVLIKYANYNLLFGIVYLIFEIFGLMDQQIYN
ncbi:MULTISPECIES: hypothetical protein [unclassified Lactobacillus]|uniref:hypothetical protein n=2 Tax=Lactobacillus TaxID=1578 RepID=UPI000EFA86A6|nr:MULTISPECIES: hypothetical protein [unclassified Lactobacillus]RMC24374.1 hypothetical protein F5ESL0247_04165 [Lactobacillus sp. ESL0247]RMC28513.1 hypothetical protein F5ESL0246_04165 [Lactobacillus sp. ESL0246]RMC31704.1 hypothetical protein F5ESL0245_04170 [Lactobacillus sp. ESL0245]RMC48858.1 hypothetical protein F5ESL0228_04460 [Lactobacillus sp. ESL0228]